MAELKPSAEMILTADALREAVRLASKPGTPAPVYRPATRDAVKFARTLFRQFVALEWRENLKRSVDASAVRRVEPVKTGPRYTPDWRG